MKVELIDFTGAGREDEAWHAAHILLFTKHTRLTLHSGLLSEIQGMPEEEKAEGLAYMANTLPSSWEFVNFTFLISGVSRAFTHQLVRTRTASYAQQAMRVVDVSQGFEYYKPDSVMESDEVENIYDEAMDKALLSYKQLIEAGAKTEDARGVLPTNVSTNIMMCLNLRTLADLIAKRTSGRVQEEYRRVAYSMKEIVEDKFPWITPFIEPKEFAAHEELDRIADELSDQSLGGLADRIRKASFKLRTA